MRISMIGELAVAAALGADGHEVLVYELRDMPRPRVAREV